MPEISAGDVSEAGPRFCPRCDRDATEGPEVTLCPDCGDGLRPQGHCGVCERFWRLEVGAPCPKHDLELELGPLTRPKFEPGARWVTVKTFQDPLDAEAPRLRLEAEGIPTFLEGTRMASRSMYHVATGGTGLMVPEALVDDARVLLDQTWATPELPGDDLDDAWDDLAPTPGDKRRRVMKGLIPWILISLFLISAGSTLLGSCQAQAR